MTSPSPSVSHTKKLRIAVLNRRFGYRFGGAEKYAATVVEELATRHEVHVFAQEIEHTFPNVTYHQISCPLAKPRWINQFWFAWQTWRQTRRGFDVVHSHEYTWHGDLQTVHVRPFRVGLFHDCEPIKRCIKWLSLVTSPRLLTYWLLEAARFRPQPNRHIIATSNQVMTETLQAYPAAAPHMHVIAPGVHPPRTSMDPTSARRQLGLPQDKPLALFVGNDYVKKGLSTLLDALHQVPSMHLAVVGNDQRIATFQDRAEQLEIANRVHFLGSMTDMTPAYRAADLLVHPTTEDTYAMVVLEAMAHGLPVIVSSAHYCGIAADLTQGVNALILENPHDARALTQHLEHLLNDSSLQQRLSVAGQQFSMRRTWQTVAEQHEVLMQQITASPASRERWLVLAHAFNMDGRAASQTITDKIPHLQAAGIELVVLAGVMGHQDHRFEHHRLWCAGPSGLRFELRHVLRKHIANRWLYRLCMVMASLPLLPFILIERICQPVESSWSWQFSAARKGRQLARDKPFDLIYSTGGAFAAHLAGHRLQQKLGIPWLAEIHDPMVQPGHTPSTRRQKAYAQVESIICTHADRVIWFTEQAMASALRRNPQLGKRGRVMLPGVDSPFKDLMPVYQGSSKLVIGHFGSLTSTRTLIPFLHALRQIEQHKPAISKDIELHIYGGMLDSVSAKLAQQWGLMERIHSFGRLETDPGTGLSGRDQVLARMRQCDVLLLVHGEDASCEEYIPSKLYEYLWMQRPVLATVHDNPQMASILRGQGHRVAEATLHQGGSSQDAASELAAHIVSLWQQWRNSGLPDSGRISPYTTQASTQQLIAWARELIHS